MTTVLLFATLVVLLALDVPIAFALGLSCVAALLVSDPASMIEVARKLASSLTVFYPFIAVPFFLLAGELMNRGGLSRRLIEFAQALVGHLRGGLAMASVLASMLFGGISGASSADTAAIGSIMVPAMIRRGYGRSFATSLQACAGSTGAMIPPSCVMIIMGVVANLSIEKLFLGGVVPGVLVGLSLMGMGYWHARKTGVPLEPRASLREVVRGFGRTVFAILMVVIIVGGIMSGAFTATEASVVAVLYALVVGFFVYRELRVSDLLPVLTRVARTTSVLGFLIATAFLFKYVLALEQVPEQMARVLTAASFGNKYLFLLLLNILLFVIGTFLDIGPALIILVPVLMPAACDPVVGMGIDPLHFGVFVVINLTIGLISPPVGTTLFVACGLSKTTVSEVFPTLLRFLLVLAAIQLLITYVPALVLFLPALR